MFTRTYKKLSDFVTRVKNTVVELAHLVVEWFQTTDKKAELALGSLALATVFALFDLTTTAFAYGAVPSATVALKVFTVSLVGSLLFSFVESFHRWFRGVVEPELDALSEKELEDLVLQEALELDREEWTTEHKVAYARAEARAKASPTAVRTVTL
jgi:hypothetical protein